MTAPGGSPIRVLVADDHALFRKGIVSLLGQREEFHVVGEAGSGREAVARAQEHRPHVVLMDVKMPDGDGIWAARAIKEALPETEVLMLTVSDQDEDLFAAVKAGARGYLLKNVEPEQLADCLLRVAEGEAIVPRAMVPHLLKEFGSLARKMEAVGGGPLSTLTKREEEILQQLARGSTNKEIAQALGITENTVKIHLRSILKKLHVNNRIQAALYAQREGLAAFEP